MGLFTLVILGIVGVGLVILVIGFLLKSIFHVEGKKKGINIPKMLLQLGIVIYFIGICYFKPQHNSMVNASMLIAGTIALIFICFSHDIFETIRAIFLGIIFGFCSSFIVGISSIFSDDVNGVFNNFSLILLCVAGFTSLFSSGEYLSTNFYKFKQFTDNNNSGTEKKKKKVTATTFNWSKNYSTTTYRDQDGNETEVDHWKF